jgi:hypothetical protein
MAVLQRLQLAVDTDSGVATHHPYQQLCRDLGLGLLVPAPPFGRGRSSRMPDPSSMIMAHRIAPLALNGAALVDRRTRLNFPPLRCLNHLRN